MSNAPSGMSIEQGHHPVHEELGGYEGSKLGMWLFLATELLLFGVMFCAFAIFHAKFVNEFKLAQPLAGQDHGRHQYRCAHFEQSNCGSGH
jgi:heme/copper-type cytochrome/quinol oxidase subunit 3